MGLQWPMQSFSCGVIFHKYQFISMYTAFLINNKTYFFKYEFLHVNSLVQYAVTLTSSVHHHK